MIWSERTIGGALQRQVFNRAVLVVDNCLWTGYEADLLIVEPKLRLIDVEIKISRADLKADFAKDKWIQSGYPYGTPYELRPRTEWPRQVWKHYYAVPEDIWNDDLLPCLGSSKSGVLLLRERKGVVNIRCHRRTTPNRDARKLTPAEVLDVARLASLRLWNAYGAVDRAHEDNRRTRAMYETPKAIVETESLHLGGSL
jgi:hypothetical protein